MRPVALRRIGALLLALGLLGSLGVAPAFAAGITVNSLADTTADDGFCTLREATIAANTDTASGAILGECAPGSGSDAITFSVSGTITLASDLPILYTAMSITGGGAITVSGASAVQIINVNASGNVALSGLTITAGLNPGVGGGVINFGTLSITNSTISNNTAGASGGGIANGGSGVLTITGSTVSGNSAAGAGGGGGGILNGNLATLTVANSTISGNSASGGHGGGIRNFGPLTVTDSTISGNTAVGVGGGIVNFTPGTLTISNSTLSGNVANLDSGGGIYSNGTLTIGSSTISGNSSTQGGGGGVITVGSPATITNSTISGNASLLWGGGISSGGTTTLTNSTISGNSSTQGGGGIQGLGSETVVNSIIAGNSTGGNPSGADQADVLETVTTSIIGVPGGKSLADILVPAGLADNGGPTKTIALALVAGNPAIDTATAAVCAASPINALDQRGSPRPAACDIGAYEAQPPTVAAHAAVSVAATSASGAVVTYTPPAGTNEQGVAASVACLPTSGSAFVVGTTTVTCTATDAVGHTGTGSFSVTVASFVLPDAATVQPRSGTGSLLSLIGLLGLVGVVGLRQASRPRRRRLG